MYTTPHKKPGGIHHPAFAFITTRAVSRLLERHFGAPVHALELLLRAPHGSKTIALVASRAARTAQNFAGRPVTLHLFHTDGRELLAL